MKVLVTGGVRSGKSFHAESLLLAASHVTYVAPGPTVEEDSDPDWAARIAAHQDRRPTHWSTRETRDLASAIAEGEDALIIDCLGTWLAAQIDELDGWSAVQDEWEPELMQRLDAGLRAIAPESRGAPRLLRGSFGADAGALGAASLPMFLNFSPRADVLRGHFPSSSEAAHV